jgi:hypothetical protein
VCGTGRQKNGCGLKLNVENTHDVNYLFDSHLDMRYNLPREKMVPYCFNDVNDLRGNSSVNVLLFCQLQSLQV